MVTGNGGVRPMEGTISMARSCVLPPEIVREGTMIRVEEEKEKHKQKKNNMPRIVNARCCN